MTHLTETRIEPGWDFRYVEFNFASFCSQQFKFDGARLNQTAPLL